MSVKCFGSNIARGRNFAYLMPQLEAIIPLFSSTTLKRQQNSKWLPWLLESATWFSSSFPASHVCRLTKVLPLQDLLLSCPTGYVDDLSNKVTFKQNTSVEWGVVTLTVIKLAVGNYRQKLSQLSGLVKTCSMPWPVWPLKWLRHSRNVIKISMVHLLLEPVCCIHFQLWKV